MSPLQKPPNYAVGLLLNIVLPGSGFSYLGRWGWHLAWFITFGVIASIFLEGSIHSSIPLWLTSTALAFMIVQYHFLYKTHVKSLSIRRISPLEKPVNVVFLTLHAIFAAATWPLALFMLAAIQLGREQARFDKAPLCALSLVHFEKLHRVSHTTFATVQQLESLYTPDCKSSPQITQLTPPTSSNFSISVRGVNENTVWKVNKDGFY